MLTLTCSHCGGKMEVRKATSDENTRCDLCGQLVSIPKDSATQDTGQITLAVDTVPRTGPHSASDPSSTKLYEFLAPPAGPGELGRLGSYRVLKVLGSGGMGVVFLAEDLQLQRTVALKCLLPTLAATEDARKRFFREARAAAAIDHSNVVTIYQVGEDRGIPYLAMQLLKGESLEDRMRHVRKFSVAEVLRVGREIAEGLAAAHARGLMHRDIKPANIWLESLQDRVKLLDFGLARGVGEDTQVTQQGTVLGTPAYMAPEQASGQAVDARCDLFSLGCVLYQMATGQPPFQGQTTISLLLAVVNTHPSSPHDLNQNIPAVVSDLLLRLLTKNPDQRPPTARTVVEAIAALQQSGVVDLEPTLERARPTAGPLTAPTQPAVETQRVRSAPPLSTSILPPTSTATLPRLPRWPLLGGIAALVLILIGAALLWMAFLNPGADPSPRNGQVTPAVVKIGIAYGTEKKKWLEAAVTQFGQTPEGKSIQIHLFPLGSLEGAQAIWKDEDSRIQVWAPASSLFRDTLVQRWRKKHTGNPILKEESLALTPGVFVFWEDRYQAFVKKYGKVTFSTIGQALAEPGGWGAIAGQPDWGSFKFSHTDPAKSNSGLMTLVLMAHEYQHKNDRLTPAAVQDPAFWKWVRNLEQHIPHVSHSTGALMEDMVRRGPSSFDALFVYENVVIDYFKAAQGRWGKLHVVYPPHNLWSDHPYYILDVPWSSPGQRQAAQTFLRFLMSEPLQRQALAHGFRPGDVNIAVQGVAESPFLLYPNSGLRVDLQGFVETPGDEVVESLLLFWEKTRETK